MIHPKKPTGRTSSMPVALVLGGICSLLVVILGSAILAKLIDSNTIPETGIGYGILIMIIMAAFLGAKLAYQKVKRQRLMVCMSSGVILFLLLLSITALFFGGQYNAVGVTALLILCGSGLAVLPGRGSKRVGRRK
jgi:putative membrane protein (TIGR04086 family)